MGLGAAAIRAGAAFVEIFAADSKFQQSMTKVRTTIATVGQQMRRAGTGMFLGGAAIGAPLMLAVRSAANFENALFDASASAGLTAAEVEKIRAKSLELSKAGLGGPAAIAQAFTALVKAGMPLEQALGGAAEAVIQFASNAGIDVTQAAETASDAMNVFGVSSTQATDILKAAADSSSTSVQAMVMAFSQSSAVAGMANQSMQTLAAALAILANNGVKGSDAGTSVKTMLLRLTAPADEAAAMLQKVGLSADSFRGADGKVLPLANVLDILNNALAGLSEGQRDQALLKIFGTDAIRAGTILLRSGSAGLASMGQAMAASGTNADAYRTKMSGITGAMQTVTSATERLQITVATALGPAFQRAAQSVAGFMNFLGQLATDFPGLVTTAAAVSVGLLAIGTAAIAIGSSLQGLATIIGVTQKAMALLAANPAVLGGLALAAVAVGGIGLALRQLWPDFKTTTDEWLKMVGLMKDQPPPGQGGKLVEARDIRPNITSARGQADLQRVVERQQFGEDVNVPAEFKRIVDEEASRVRGDASLSKSAREKQLFKLAQLSSALGQQIAGSAAPPPAAPAEGAVAGGDAAPPGGAPPASPTDKQKEDAARVVEDNMTPSQKIDAERNKLLDLLNAKALSEEEFLKAVNRIQEDANKEQAEAAKDRAKQLQDKAAQLREEVATPEEKLRARIDEIQSLPLDPETRQRAIEKAKADAVDAMTARGGGEPAGISSAGTFGSAAMLGVGPELSDPMRQTAENTRRMVEELAAMNLANEVPANQQPAPAAPPQQFEPLAGGAFGPPNAPEAPAAPAAPEAPAAPAAPAAPNAPAAPATPPVPSLAVPIGAEVAAPRVAGLQQQIAGGADAATATATTNAGMQMLRDQMVAAIDRTTAAVESTLEVLKEIAGNTAEMGGVFV